MAKAVESNSPLEEFAETQDEEKTAAELKNKAKKRNLKSYVRRI